jgi:hypothetical protein
MENEHIESKLWNAKEDIRAQGKNKLRREKKSQ